MIETVDLSALPAHAPQHDEALPQVGGVPLITADERLTAAELRQRACTELLRQAAMCAGLLASDDPVPEGGACNWAISDAAAEAIEAYLAHEIQMPDPSEDACRRHHAAHLGRYAVGESVHLRHVLFAVTPGVDVNALRQRAEACLLDLRCPTDGEGDRFSEVARSTSNCPSGADGGLLGALTRDDCAPEFAAEIFGHPEVGVLPRLVHSRFGLHVVEVLAREPGQQPPFEAVQAAVAQALRQHAYATALRQLIQLLAGQTDVQGVDLDRAETPLVQ